MAFLTGRVTATRYRVAGRSPRAFGPDHLDQLAAHAIGKQRLAAADGVEVGWTAGDHIFDTRFELAKNIINDALHFEMRLDQQKIPGELLRAYTQVELLAHADTNPSGRPSARQKREARQLARERLEAEAADGRFLRRKSIPILWDALSTELLVGTASMTVVDRLHGLFQQTFGRGFELCGAGRRAFEQAEGRGQTQGVDDAAPSPFVHKLSEVAWQPDEAGRDFLGNEFLLWLWHVLDEETDTLELADKSTATVMLTRTLLLECPRAESGKETITSDAPTRLPEARRAIQSGKWPRKVGMTVVRHDQQYELTLHAETLAITGAKLPPPDEDGGDERARQEGRLTALRQLLETLDLLYDAFGARRFGGAWAKDLARMRKWLAG
jgi:hypothetical protein